MNTNKRNYCDEGIDNLRIAIVQRAADDYADAFMGKSVGGRDPVSVITELDRYFDSDDFHMLTNIDKNKLIKMIKINALEKVIDAYSTAFAMSNSMSFHIKVRTPPECENINFCVPPRLETEFREAMKKQMRALQKELNSIKVGS